MNIDYEKIEKAWFTPKEKTAKEMFEELGYKRLPKKYNKNMILYENENMLKDYKIIIYFSLTDKKIQFSPYYRYSMQELKVISKQCEELGWK